MLTLCIAAQFDASIWVNFGIERYQVEVQLRNELQVSQRQPASNGRLTWSEWGAAASLLAFLIFWFGVALL
ncbi:hypothetical protein [Microvirga antarctica]|uniref:hypothetical protein n=1 Tax=Microvirga antarctica TaxID=2819233 RepID=UPI001B302953|nr:hypothetical protein [Microvirga antarctica]